MIRSCKIFKAFLGGVILLVALQLDAKENYFKPATGEVVAQVESLEQILTMPEGGVSVFSGVGELLPNFPAWVSASVFTSSPVLADIDGNGVNEIVVIGRNAADVYTLYAYNGSGQTIALLPISNATIYYDPVAVTNGVKKDILVSTNEGDVLKFEFQDGNFISSTILSLGVPAALSVDNNGKLYVTSPQTTTIDIYFQNTWALEKTLAVTNPIIYPVTVSGDMIYGIANNGGLIAVNKVTGQQADNFPVQFASFAVDAPQLIDIEPATAGTEVVVQFSDGSRKVVAQAGSVLSTELAKKSFEDDTQFATTTQDNDLDGDGMTNGQEYLIGTYPNNPDTDDDGVFDGNDAFPKNPAETNDNDLDGVGDNSDSDDDNDGTPDVSDAFPFDPKESGDTDNDGLGNNIDTDDDNDGVLDYLDRFPLDPTESVDTDNDKIGNNADTDDENDGIPDTNDNCTLIKNADQADLDLDGVGNACDNCPKDLNADQLDANKNGIGDACEDQNGDNTPPEVKNVVLTSPSYQGDEDLTLSYEVTDLDNDTTKNIYSWKVNGNFVEALNLPFESGSSDAKTTKDYSVNGLQANVYDAVWNAVGGHDGFGAYEFDYYKYMKINNNDAINFGTSDFSISAWVYHKDYTYPRTTLALIKSAGSCYVDGSVGFDVGHSYSKYGSEFCLNDGTNKIVTYITFDEGYRPPDFKDKWVHLVYVFDRTKGKIRAYVNGVRQTMEKDISSVTGSISSNSPLYIGMLYGWFLSGTLDDLVISKRALSDSQVTSIFNGDDEITKEEARLDEKWQVCVKPNDGIVDGAELCSNEFNIYNNLPTQDAPVLSLTENGDLEVTPQNIQDPDVDDVFPIVDWRLNDASIAVLNMPFEGSEDPFIVKDYSTFENNGSVFSAAWVKDGGHDAFGAYEFDGKDDYIEIKDSDSLDIGTDSMTISLWLKTSIKTYGLVLNKRIGTNASGSGFSYAISPTGWGGTSIFWFQDGTQNNNWQYAYATIDVTDGNWHHVVGVLDRKLETIKVYVDGKHCSKPVRSVPGFVDSSNAVNLKIGDKSFKGTIDDVKIYNRALMYGQILNLYNEKVEIVNDELGMDDSWQACVTLNDGIEDGDEVCSNVVSFVNNPPVHDEPLVNIDESGNLTVIPQNTMDIDGDVVVDVFDWMVDGNSLAVLNMPFENGFLSNDIVTDYTSYHNDGFVTGALHAALNGLNNSGAYQFDGAADQFVKVPGLHPTKNSYTISVWLKPEPHTERELFFNFGGSPGLQYSDLRPDNSILHYHGVSPYASVYTAQKVVVGQWNHFAATWDGATLKAYINGILDPVSYKGTVPVTMTGDTHIGSFSTSGPYKGLIDNVLLFEDALAPAQIKSIFEQGYATIVKDETTAGETWQGCVIPTDGKDDGERKCSAVVIE